MIKFCPPQSSYHFSIDDVFNSLIEVSDKNIFLFSHPFFRFIKKLHDRFNTTIDLYCFYQREIDGRMRTLQDVSVEIKKTIQENPWLRFGPHALDYYNPPYAQSPNQLRETLDKIYREITRFAGEENFSYLARLHYFSEAYEMADYFDKRGVKALFSTDKEVMSHRMPQGVKNSLQSKGVAIYRGMTFIRTQFRVENFITMHLSDEQTDVFLQGFLDKFGFITFFTHEYDIPTLGIKPATIDLLKKCKNFKLQSI